VEKKPVLAETETSDSDTFTKFLPFGIDQFRHGKYALGSTLMAGQFLALGLGIHYNLEAKKLTKSTNFAIEERTARRQSLPEEERHADTEETEAYRFQKNTEIENLNKNSYLSFGLFAILWAGGIMEAWYSGFNRSQQNEAVSIGAYLIPVKLTEESSPFFLMSLTMGLN